jgi:hypothetical protein
VEPAPPVGALDPLTHRVLPAEAPAHLAPRVDLPVEAKAPRSPVPSRPRPWDSRRSRSVGCR